MSIQNMNKAFSLIERYPEYAIFEGPVSDELIDKAETALSIKFPPTYKLFLKKHGAGSFSGRYYYGITSDNFEKKETPNGIWYTLEAREKYNLPNDLVLIYSCDDGSCYALEAFKDDSESEALVVIWHPDLEPGEELEYIADDFGDFFLESIDDSLD